jgi:predicted ArsR family transcriptional regulator
MEIIMEENIDDNVKGRMKDKTDWELIAKIRRSETRKKIFVLLLKNPSSATDIAHQLGINRTTVVFHFTKLKKFGVIEPYTDLPNFQIYGPTEKGEEIGRYV